MEPSWRDYASNRSRIGRKPTGQRGGPQSNQWQRDETAEVAGTHQGGKKSAEAAMRQFATQERQAEKGKMREWKDQVMQEMARELHIIRQTHEEAMEAQRQGFQIELERVGGKLEQLELRLENEVKALRFPGQHTSRKTPSAKAALPSSGGNQDMSDKRQTEGLKDREGSQEHQQVETHVTKASTHNQPKQTHPGLSQKSYAQVAKEKPLRPSSEKPWTEVKYTNKKRETQKQAKSQEPGGRKILFPRKEAQPKESEEDIMLALIEALQKAGEPASIRFSRVKYHHRGLFPHSLPKKRMQQSF